MAERRRRLTYDQRRQTIVDAAVEVFADKGYSGAAVVDVSDRAGITKATLYDHFPSKREMYLAVLEMQRDDALKAVLPRIAVDLPPRDAVANALDVFFEWAETNPNTWRLLFGERYGEPEIAVRHRQLQSEAFLAIASAVLDVRKPRSQEAGMRLQMVAEVIGGAVHGLARWWWYEAPRDPPHRPGRRPHGRPVARAREPAHGLMATSRPADPKEAVMLEARLNVVTLGVHDLPLMRSFYEALGWTSHTDNVEFARFDTGGATLALFLAHKLAAEAHSADVPEAGYRGVTVGIVVESADAVDAALRLVEQAGGRLLGEAVEREWGGRSGYFADPEGNAWEVAWLPGGTIADGGVLVWP